MNSEQIKQYIDILNGNGYDNSFPYDTIIEKYPNYIQNINHNNYKNNFNYNKKTKMDKSNINEILGKLNKQNLNDELQEGRLENKIIREIEINASISLLALLNWIFFVQNAFKFIKYAENYFEKIMKNQKKMKKWKLKKRQKKKKKKKI